jgi:hypothetical protein
MARVTQTNGRRSGKPSQTSCNDRVAEQYLFFTLSYLDLLAASAAGTSLVSEFTDSLVHPPRGAAPPTPYAFVLTDAAFAVVKGVTKIRAAKIALRELHRINRSGTQPREPCQAFRSNGSVNTEKLANFLSYFIQGEDKRKDPRFVFRILDQAFFVLHGLPALSSRESI